MGGDDYRKTRDSPPPVRAELVEVRRGRTLLQAFTLLELLIVLALLGVLTAVLLPSAAEFPRMLAGLQERTLREGEFERFLMMLKTELVQSGYGLDSGAVAPPLEVSESEVVLRADFNRDGDTRDSRETLRYRFVSNTNKLQRRSGVGNYQTLSNHWNRCTSPPPVRFPAASRSPTNSSPIPRSSKSRCAALRFDCSAWDFLLVGFLRELVTGFR